MPKWLIAVALAMLAFIPISVQAQNNITFSRMEVDLWPEYDQPSMLVIYHIFLTPDTSLPASLSISIPASVGAPSSVAVRETDGMLYNLAYTRTVQGATALVNFTTTGTEVQLEYYDARLIGKDGARSYTYHWLGNYPVTALTLQVQQPVNATNMQISPSLGSGITGEGGLTYYTAMVGSVPAGTDFSLKVDYAKTTSALSAESLKVVPSQPVNDNTSGRVTLQTVVLWVLGGLGVLLVSFGAIWYTRSNRETLPAVGRKRHASEPALEPAFADDRAIYCHQCGKRASAGDVFCRTCGTKLRK
jgi:hypothetical protein